MDNDNNNNFHIADEILKSINLCLVKAREYRSERNYASWSIWLENLYIAIEFKLTDDESAMADKLVNSSKRMSFNKYVLSFPKSVTKLENALIKTELFLQRLADKYGLLLPANKNIQ